MAPWPAQGNELKAPDRNKTSDNRTLDNLKSKSDLPEDKKLVKGISKEDQSESKKKDVHSLDDGQLKALLDEAIQYKNPKDREGKSKIFRELLQKVEADDSDCSYPVVGIRGSGGRRALRNREGSKAVAISERASRGGSLQNIFHAASSAEFDTHQYPGGARKKNKRQGPGSSVSARQREGGSLPSNVNAGWPLESWQSDQAKKKGASFERDSLQPNHVPVSFGNTAYCNSSSVAIASTQARRQTLKHSASNELPSSKKSSPGELYPLRRHHSSSDQLRSFELSVVKLKNQSENSSMVRKMPQLPKPSECVSFDMSSLNLEIKKLSELDPSLSFEKKLQGFQNSEKYRVTSCEVESDNPGNNNNNNNNNQEVFTTRASLEVEPVDSSIELGFGENRILNGIESVQLSDNYPSVQCIVGDRTRISDASNQARVSEQSFGLRPHMYRNLNMNMIVNISSKTASDSARTDENGNALNVPSLTSRGANIKKNKQKKLLAEKNVVFSQNIAGYVGDNENIDEILNFIESDKAKNKQLKKLTKGKKHERKRQNMQKSSSLEEVSQRNIEDLTESSESERTTIRKPRIETNTDPGLRDRRRWGEQGFLKSGSQNDLNMEQGEENNSDSEFQMVTKKQRKRKVNDPNPKRTRSHRNSRRSPRRKSTSSVSPSERSGDSDLDSVHSLPVGGAPTASYADIAAGNSPFFTSKAISEISGNYNGNNVEKVESVSAVKTNEIEKWCDSVSQHWDKEKVNNDNSNVNNDAINENNSSNNGNFPSGNNNNNNNTSTINKNNSINANNNQNVNNNVNANNHTNINSNSDLKNCYSKQDNNPKQNLEKVEVNEICDNNNVKKLKNIVIVDKSVDSKATAAVVSAAGNKIVELPTKNDFNKKIDSNCDSDQCAIVDVKSNDSTKKNWNKKSFSREDFPCLPVKTESGSHRGNREILSEQNAFAKTKHFSSFTEPAEKSAEKTKSDSIAATKTSKKINSPDDEEEEGRHRRSKSVGPNPRPPVILLHDERTKDTGVCEITFGFEVNEQLLTSDETAPAVLEEEKGEEEVVEVEEGGVAAAGGGRGEEEVELVDEVSSSSSSGNGKTPESKISGDDSANGGGVLYKDIIENQNAYVSNSSKSAVMGGVTNATLQELFKRHETISMHKTAGHPSVGNVPLANSIAGKNVPPVTPVQFNYDKIVTFVRLAWEDVMRNGKIQYYTIDN